MINKNKMIDIDSTLNDTIHIKMEIKLNIQQMNIIEYLQRKGYEIKYFSYILPSSSDLFVPDPEVKVNTFTATKKGEEQTKERDYIRVFEKEIYELLNDLIG